jgi:hypothetical protein
VSRVPSSNLCLSFPPSFQTASSKHEFQKIITTHDDDDPESCCRVKTLICCRCPTTRSHEDDQIDIRKGRSPQVSEREHGPQVPQSSSCERSLEVILTIILVY